MIAGTKGTKRSLFLNSKMNADMYQKAKHKVFVAYSIANVFCSTPVRCLINFSNDSA